MKIIIRLLTTCVLCWAMQSQAQYYDQQIEGTIFYTAGLGVGSLSNITPDIDPVTDETFSFVPTINLGLGREFTKNHIVGITWTIFGSAEATDDDFKTRNGEDSQLKGNILDICYAYSFEVASNFDINLKAGINWWEAEMRTSDDGLAADGDEFGDAGLGITLGFTMDYLITPSHVLTFDFDTFHVGLDNSSDNWGGMAYDFAIGYKYRLGQGEDDNSGGGGYGGYGDYGY